MSVLQRKCLQELRFDVTNILVVALVIGKSTTRSFTSKRSSATSAVVTFTVRDSKQFFTNCTVWGSEEKILEYYRAFKIGDIIDIITPRVTPISPTNKEFQPQTSTPYTLTVNEGFASLEPHIFDTALITTIQNLVRVPIKPINLALSLADIYSSGSHTTGQFVDLFVVVRMCKPARTIRTRAGEEREYIEVIVMDRSHPSGMSFSIWHDEWIRRAERQWKPYETVLYLMDARLDYSTFYKATVLSLSSKTIILENPDATETKQLLQFASTVPTNGSEWWNMQGVPDPESINTLMTVQQIFDRATGTIGGDSEQFTAMLYAIVTNFDLDGGSRVVAKKCKFCKRVVMKWREYCDFEQCQLSISMDSSGDNNFEYYFDINVHLTDHTGTLTECRLTNRFAEKILDCNVRDFEGMRARQKAELKWKTLMERVVAKLVVKKRSVTRARTFYMLVDMQPLDVDQVAENILVY